jgi:hypothetical protein
VGHGLQRPASGRRSPSSIQKGGCLPHPSTDVWYPVGMVDPDQPLSEAEATTTFEQFKENVRRVATAPKAAPKVTPKRRTAKRKRRS